MNEDLSKKNVSQGQLEELLGVEFSFFEDNSFSLYKGNTYHNIIAIEKEAPYQMKIQFEEYKNGRI